MEIQHYNKLKNDYAAKTRVIVKQIQDCFGLRNKEISELMGLSSDEYLSFINYKSSINIDSLQNLMNEYRISLDSLKSGNIDFDILIKHKKGQLNNLSEKYTVGAFSKRRTILNTLKFIKKNYGYHLYDMTERYFQLNDHILSNPDELINVHFIEDLYSYLSKQHRFQNHDFFRMGCHNLMTLENTKFGASICEVSHPKELYRNLVTRDVKLLEKNSDYRIVSLSDVECVLQSEAGQEVCDLLKLNKVGNKETCKYREGFFSILPKFINLPQAVVLEKKCVHKGDSVCEFHIDFSKATTEHNTRQQFSLHLH